MNNPLSSLSRKKKNKIENATIVSDAIKPVDVSIEPIDIADFEDMDNIFGDDVFADEDYSIDSPKFLTVNDQPFIRWIKHVALSLGLVAIVVLGVTLAVSAPLHYGLVGVGATWIIILALTAPEAIIPFKKTHFNLNTYTVRVGQHKERSLSDIHVASLHVKKREAKLWLGFSKKPKDGFFVPLKSNKISLESDEILALKTIIPYTSIVKTDVGAKFRSSKTFEEVSQETLLEYIAQL